MCTQSDIMFHSIRNLIILFTQSVFVDLKCTVRAYLMSIEIKCVFTYMIYLIRVMILIVFISHYLILRNTICVFITKGIPIW